MQKYSRQRGLVDQAALMKKRVLVSGSSEGVGELIVMLMQLGAGAFQPGCIGIVATEKMPKSVFWKLMFGSVDSWDNWIGQSIQGQTEVKLIAINEIIDDEWDIHLTLGATSGAKPDVEPLIGNVNGFVNGIRGVVKPYSAITPLDWKLNDRISCKCDNNSWTTSHPVEASMHTMVASTIVHEALKVMEVRSIVPVSEIWLTVTCRIETTDLEQAREHVRGIGGKLLDVTHSQDGLATIARYRYPKEVDLDPRELIQIENQTYESPKSIDVGFIPWASESKDMCYACGDENLIKAPQQSNVSILGVGGLGSWATPLICQALPNGLMNIIDGDNEIAIHNLNRQVLYQEQDIGSAKASTAASRLSELFPHITFNPFETFLRRSHVGEISDEGIDLNEFFPETENSESTNQGIDDELRNALKTSHICLGCLDNMQARTILNEAAMKSEIPMINGGGESIHGVVERLHDEGCMICRYGREAAYASEIVSCTEEGARPIISIVTTTAYVGAMMAAITILELYGSQIHHSMRYTWLDGIGDQNNISKPPWFDEPCECHF